jgi:hypothetical protein
MAQSTAYVLSAPYSDASAAYNLGIYQGTQIVYSDSSTQSGVTEFYADSRLTQPIIGDSVIAYTGNWFGFRLLSDPFASPYACTISPDGEVSID